ncbi:hypothetical protein ABFY60_02890 [Lysinibacillus pakistanensis]|uniref:hypothetical protein n=1 Tax=Lysinibacillus pakistanensis TaxID=759811 RepID=UPI003D27C371
MVSTEQLIEAREEWLKLVDEFSIKDIEHIVIFPYYTANFTYYSLLYLKEFATNTDKKIYVIVDNLKVIKALAFFKLEIIPIYLSNEKIQRLLHFYNLYMFTDQLKILSPTQPNGRSAYNLVEQGIIDIEEFISVGILQNRKFKRVPLITYDGNDAELIELFNIVREDV